MALAVREIPRSHNHSPQEGVVKDADGVPGYADLPATPPDMLRAHVDTRQDAETVVEPGGERLTYAQLWERTSRVAGGLRAAGVRRGGRGAVRYAAGTDWSLAFWGTILADGIAVAVTIRSVPP
ncbi:AMP-binding protein [Streptomyces globisporus]|uniref:AMP-binding protein n=1 Tax=Streptomyces globisporus TaxID=1908 RepID=UPI00068E9764|nr:AMP-binding protein [Streptomyces globisporus]